MTTTKPTSKKKRTPRKTSKPHSKGYDQYLHSERWQKMRLEAFRMVGGRCIDCGGSATDLHHLNYINLGKERIGIDVVPLCLKCHRKCHWKKNWDNYGARERMGKSLIAKFRRWQEICGK